MSAKFVHPKFYGVLWNCLFQPIWPNPSSIEFHEIGVLHVPWNSMEFHGTASVNEVGALQVPWNSMDLLLQATLAHIKLQGIPCNSMELLVLVKLEHCKLYGIPWNCSCQRNWRPLNFMELHGITWNGSCHRIVTLQVPWNSVEFHGTARVSEIGATKFHLIPWNSVKPLASSILAQSEFHGMSWIFTQLLVSSKLAQSKFHGIPWNCLCQRNGRTPYSMEFHWTARVSEIGALKIPWNSMELLMSAKLGHSKFHGIPWNLFYYYLLEPFVSPIRRVLNFDRIPQYLRFPILMTIIFHIAGWIISVSW